MVQQWKELAATLYHRRYVKNMEIKTLQIEVKISKCFLNKV